jgi:hypothetical protein
MRNFHVPLPDEVYDNLRKEAERSKRSATTLARRAIEIWLKQQRRAALHQEIAAYADKFAGTDADLDQSLEAASIEHWLDEEGYR